MRYCAAAGISLGVSTVAYLAHPPKNDPTLPLMLAPDLKIATGIDLGQPRLRMGNKVVANIAIPVEKNELAQHTWSSGWMQEGTLSIEGNVTHSSVPRRISAATPK